MDDRLATVGSINVDYRPFHLNFELVLMVTCKTFAGELEAFKTAVRPARLLSTVQ